MNSHCLEIVDAGPDGYVAWECPCGYRETRWYERPPKPGTVRRCPEDPVRAPRPERCQQVLW